LIGISPGVDGVHIGGFLQYLCDALLVLGTILQGVARSGDKFGHAIRVFSEIVALHDSDREDRRRIAFGQLFALVHDTSSRRNLAGKQYLS
jgi:hypothetical protein